MATNTHHLPSAERSHMQTIAQQRAKDALAWATTQPADGISKTMLSAANSLPAMILMNGLGQAAAFYKSKGDKEHTALYNLLSNWLVQEGKPYARQDDLLTGITSGNMQIYRAAQVEALAYLQWVKKFAKAYQAKDKEDSDTHGGS